MVKFMDNLSLLFRGNLGPKVFGVNYIDDPENPGDPGDPPPGDPPADPPPADPPPAGKFFDGFSEEMRVHPSVTKFGSSEELAKSYVSLEKKIGDKGVMLLKEGATETDIATFREGMGIPKDSTGYTQIALPDGTDKRVELLGAEEFKSFQEFAHKINLTPGQVNALQQYDVDRVAASYKTNDADSKTTMEDAETAMRGELGSKYDASIVAAKNVVTKLAGADADSLLATMGNNIPFLKMMVNISSKVSEDTLGPAGGSPLNSPAEAQSKIAAIQGDKKHAYWDGNHPLHDEAVEEMKSLYEQAYPSTK